MTGPKPVALPLGYSPIYMVEGGRFELPNPMGADLQSAAFSHFATPPKSLHRTKLFIQLYSELKKCRPEDLNPQPTDYKSVALPIELGRHGDPYGTRTRDTAVKGRCLNRLTKGPKERLIKVNEFYYIQAFHFCKGLCVYFFTI